jgi:predicted esterase
VFICVENVMGDVIHQNQPALQAGAPLAQAQAAMILLHGRGASAEDILALAREFTAPEVAFIAPQAAGHTWYPNRFIMPVATNEPHLSSALATIDNLVAKLNDAGLAHDHIFLLGFSQGACLALEYAAQHPQRYAGVVALSGALIENGDQPRDYAGSLDGTPAFLGCSDADFHIPAQRVLRSEQVLRRMGANVTAKLYPHLGHTVNDDEIDAANAIIGPVKRDA